MNREDAFGEVGVEGVALVACLIVEHIFSNSPVIAVEMEIDGGEVARVVDVEHLATIVGGDAQTRDIAVGRSVDGSSHTFVATHTEVEAAVEVVGAHFGKGARGGGREMQRRHQLGCFLGLCDNGERQDGEDGYC